jgi:hypothetical protein
MAVLTGLSHPESKRDKKRREIVERVEKFRREAVDKREVYGLTFPIWPNSPVSNTSYSPGFSATWFSDFRRSMRPSCPRAVMTHSHTLGSC